MMTRKFPLVVLQAPMAKLKAGKAKRILEAELAAVQVDKVEKEARRTTGGLTRAKLEERATVGVAAWARVPSPRKEERADPTRTEVEGWRAMERVASLSVVKG